MEYNIQHNIAENRFEIVLDNLKSVIDYTLDSKNNLLTVTHTGFPSQLEGRGIAAALTKALLSYARNNSLKVIPLCSYVKVYIDRHPEWNDLLA